ncbi:MAG: hypothetical protein JWM48_1822 [Mycobacterium sp.]|nr:hypothetical protein [Mycobacterium sp.]
MTSGDRAPGRRVPPHEVTPPSDDRSARRPDLRAVPPRQDDSGPGPAEQPGRTASHRALAGPVAGTGLLGGGLALAGGAAVAAAALGPAPVLAAVVIVVQVLTALAWLALLDAPGGAGAFTLATAAGVTADALLLAEDTPSLGPLAGVVAVALLACTVQQLARRAHRTRVTDSLAASLSTVVLLLLWSTLLGLRVTTAGGTVVTVVGLSAGVALAVSRLADRFAPRPGVPGLAGHGWAGLALALVAGVAVGAVTALARAPLTGRDGAVLGLAAGFAVLVADVTLARLLPELDPHDSRRRGSLTPLAALLPLALSCPLAYVLGRLLLG